MIEFRKLEGAESGRGYQLFINGVHIDEVNINAGAIDDKTGTPKFQVYIRDKNTASQFLAHSLNDMPPLEYLNIVSDFDLEFIEYIFIYHPADKPYTLTFTGEPNLATWPYPFSFASYCDELEQSIVAEHYPGMRFHAYDNNDNEFITSFEASFTISSTRNPLANEIGTYSTVLRRLHDKAVGALLARQRSHSVVETFNFPDSVRVPCEQYLLYFVRFLEDLGVEATADIQHEAGQVLFAVTPTNKDEALDKIHTALKTYLQLASSSIDGSFDSENEIAIQGLLANVDHLKSQLRLSYLMVRAQERTIQAQEVTINNQQRILSGEVLLDSLKTDTPKPEDKEEIIDGILALGKYEDKGVSVNLGELYRRLKKLFRDDD